MAQPKINVPLLAETQPQPPMQVRFQLIFVNPNLPLPCPAFRVAPGQVVQIYPINGQNVNAHPCQIAADPGYLGTPSARTLPAGVDVSTVWPTDNTGKIWAVGSTDDGLLVEITSQGVG
jgi:hypothetical protein